MTCWTDEASKVEEMQRAQALATIKRYEGVSLTECVECGDDIPADRQQAIPGCTQCTECASMAEERR